MFEIMLQWKNGKLNVHLSAEPVMGSWCLHRDILKDVPLEEELDPKIKVRDDLFFKNLEALEHTLTVATFDEDGVKGDWMVTQDDYYSSNALYRDFFALDPQKGLQHNNATVIYKVKDYDLVGPVDFHSDRSIDKFRQGIYDNKPWLQIMMIFGNQHQGKLKLDTMTGVVNHHPENDKNKAPNQYKMELELIYPLDEKHLLINKPKRSFRATKPRSAFLRIEGMQVDQQCNDLSFAFQVREEHIKYIIEDHNDSCLPYTVEGKL